MTKLYKYQGDGVRRIDVFGGRALIGDDMGLGKSLQALTWTKWRDALPCIVVCPASLKYNWQHEIALHLKMRSDILETRTVPRFRLGKHSPFVIINYEILGAWLNYLKKLKPRCVIVDECQNLRSRTTQQTKNTKKLCKNVPHVLCLSGTPFENRPEELWSTLNILRPDRFKSFRPFGMRYCDPTWTPWGVKFSGASHTDDLHVLLKHSCMIRRLKSDVLKQLPPKTRHIVPLPIDRTEYDQADADFLKWLRRTAPDKVRKARKAERVVRAGYLKRIAATAKLGGVYDWIDAFLAQPKRKLIVFGIHRCVLEPLVERYHDTCVLVHGKVRGRRRKLAFDQFNKDWRKRLFLGNMRAAGVGWNGTVASTVAFVELGWNPPAHTQAEDRAHRIGQHHGVQCFYLIAENTIEQHTAKLIQKKQQAVSEILDGGGNSQSFNLLDELERTMTREHRKPVKRKRRRLSN